MSSQNEERKKKIPSLQVEYQTYAMKKHILIYNTTVL